MYPCVFFGSDYLAGPPLMPSYFLPPVQLIRPPWERIRHVDPSFPRSVSYRHMATSQFRGKDETIAGVFYQGGYWHGPLTAQQITDITTAGFAARIITVASAKDLPASID